jgi:hypothetical protein
MNSIQDAYLINTGDGGDLVLLGNDIKLIGGIENMVYIGLFGGNPGFSTIGPKVDEQIFDFWGNYLLHPEESRVWNNSTLEFLLENTALTSSGRIKLEQAVLSDLSFMNDFATITADVQLVGVDKVRISVKVIEKSNLNSNEFVYIWSSTASEIDSLPTSSTDGQGVALNSILDFDL